MSERLSIYTGPPTTNDRDKSAGDEGQDIPGMGSRVAFLIVTWNNRDIISACLDSLRAQDHPDRKVFLFDNGSRDGTIEYVREHYPECRMHVSQRNLGFAKANNLLIAQALSDPSVRYIALINSDVELAPDWVSTIIRFLDATPNAAAAQGLTVNYFRRDEVDSHHILVQPDLQSVQYGYQHALAKVPSGTCRVFGVNAAAAIYTRRFVVSQPRHRLFDEKFYMYLEDVDASFRAILEGWDLYHVSGAIAYHMASHSAKLRPSGFALYMTFRNQAALIARNLPRDLLRSGLRLALRFERAYLPFAIENYGWPIALKILLGRIVGLLRLPLFLRDRWRIQRRRVISSEELRQIMTNQGFVDALPVQSAMDSPKKVAIASS